MTEPTDSPAAGATDRRDQVAAGLARVEERIRRACGAAGRSADEVTLTVVTKFFPASDVRLLAGLGVRHIGENRHQEAEEKVRDCADLDLVWHFIGGLQSNKAAAVAAYADVVESVDRPKLIAGLVSGAAARGTPLDVLIQVGLDPDPPTGGAGRGGRSGCPPADVPRLAERILGAEALRLGGVMGVAPLAGDPAAAFARLADVAAQVRRLAPGANTMSAGMSGDLEEAVKSGATHVRIGSAVLGARPSVG
ncbi:MAG TPA: YggS family pyridoxal phosphate-dependent enzyme [Nocardioidaceae bacterium]|nr:YggS family pyridoxal phosphate-dependent enzyme [Nocardioidaceae bacterium]